MDALFAVAIAPVHTDRLLVSISPGIHYMMLAANGKYGLGFPMSRKAFGDSAGFCFSVIASYGGRILDEEGNLDIDTPEMRAAIQYLIDVWNSGAVPSAATTWDGNSNNQFFLTGDIGIVCNSNSIMG